MAFFLRNLLPLFPLGAALGAAVTGFVLSFTCWRRIGQIFLGFALAGLWLAAMPMVANWLNLRLESQFPPVKVENLPKSDAVIVLGGVVGQPLPPRIAAELSDSVDRIMHALRIYRGGKAPVIVICAGNLPWHRAVVPEAELIADLLVELGAPRSVLILETKSRNTRENAVNAAAIFKER